MGKNVWKNILLWSKNIKVNTNNNLLFIRQVKIFQQVNTKFWIQIGNAMAMIRWQIVLILPTCNKITAAATNKVVKLTVVLSIHMWYCYYIIYPMCQCSCFHRSSLLTRVSSTLHSICVHCLQRFSEWGRWKNTDYNNKLKIYTCPIYRPLFYPPTWKKK